MNCSLGRQIQLCLIPMRFFKRAGQTVLGFNLREAAMVQWLCERSNAVTSGNQGQGLGGCPRQQGLAFSSLLSLVGGFFFLVNVESMEKRKMICKEKVIVVKLLQCLDRRKHATSLKKIPSHCSVSHVSNITNSSQ